MAAASFGEIVVKVEANVSRELSELKKFLVICGRVYGWNEVCGRGRKGGFNLVVLC